MMAGFRIDKVIETPHISLPDTPEVSVVMPCLNEAETLEACIRKAYSALQEGAISGEVIVADNGSTDGSLQIAERNGARVIHASRRGYGAALYAGFAAAQGKYVIMADADSSYDWGGIQPFVDKLRAGYQLVMGSRLRGHLAPGSMPWLHRWVGTPILTLLGNVLFKTRVSDYQCGMRGFERESLTQLGLRAPGMEFATEMLAKAAMAGLSVAEIPINYYPDGRSRPPHLKTWRDGWRHLRLMLLLSPSWLFLYPGLLLVLLGLVGSILLIPGPLLIGSIGLDTHTLLVSGIALIIGVQILTFWLCARLFAANVGLLPMTPFICKVKHSAPLRIGLIFGGLLLLSGIVPAFQSFALWADVRFGALDYRVALRWLIPGLVLIALGVHVFFASFVVSLFNLADDWVNPQ